MVSDKEIIDKYNRGDKRAFDILFQRYNEKLKNIIRLRTASEYYEDIAQEAWIKAFLNIRKYSDTNFFNWLLRIALTRHIDLYVRYSKNTKTVELNYTNFANDEAYHEVDINPLMVAILNMDHEHQKEVIMLRTYGNVSFKKIAGGLGKSINTAIGIYKYAVFNLRKKMIL